ncbi:hypothetical protein L1987_01889 [Smallanthus sonchifolius]|uniref:Uncharacterized protein n=1 Tax=Smallanthus sonchifolius TaxID=185202 RepID=A0ACB9K678_9ASTR|nr:hypothetical protein L1987_01889 [Smallanthus sonchifolius]
MGGLVAGQTSTFKYGLMLAALGVVKIFEFLKDVSNLVRYNLQGCVKRVQADETGHKHCTGQYFDYWHCVDKCVSIK